MKRKTSSSAIWFVAIMALGAGLFVLAAVNGNGSGSGAALMSAVTSEDRSKGNSSSSVVLVEYGDYQCPACAAYDPIVRLLAEDYGDRIAVVYRHFPLRTIHKQADLAARAAEAAGLQNKFWDMHAALYRNQRAWADQADARNTFLDLASELGLDMDRFEKDIDSSVVKEKVERDLQGGLVAGVNGTPTFFLNGKRIQGPGSYEAFRFLIEEALAEKP